MILAQLGRAAAAAGALHQMLLELATFFCAVDDQQAGLKDRHTGQASQQPAASQLLSGQVAQTVPLCSDASRATLDAGCCSQQRAALPALHALQASGARIATGAAVSTCKCSSGERRVLLARLVAAAAVLRVLCAVPHCYRPQATRTLSIRPPEALKGHSYARVGVSYDLEGGAWAVVTLCTGFAHPAGRTSATSFWHRNC